jgi:glycine/sarcosine N-methyltransferase
VLEADALAAALVDFAACLRPGGRLIIQSRNFDAVLAQRERWMEPQSHRSGDQEWLFVRFYDYDPDERISFHILTLHRSGPGGWQQRVTTTRLWPQRQADLLPPLAAAGFGEITAYGSLNGAPYDPVNSGNLVLTAVRR